MELISSELKLVKHNTDWKDRNLTKSVSTGQGSSGDTDIIFLKLLTKTIKVLRLKLK